MFKAVYFSEIARVKREREMLLVGAEMKFIDVAREALDG